MGSENQGAEQASNKGQFRSGASGNPKGRPRKQVQRRDGWINDATGHGTSRDRRTLTRYGVDIVTDIEAMQQWRSEWIAARIIEKKPEDALRRGWTLKLDDKKLHKNVLAQTQSIGLVSKFVQAWQMERGLGGAAIFPVLSGALGELALPLNEEAIVSVDALHVLEPQELYPVDIYKDIQSPKFGLPETYRLVPLSSGRAGYLKTEIVHESRLVIFPGIRVSKQTQPGQREGWGDSVLSRPKGVLEDFGLSWGSVATLLGNHGHGVISMDKFAELMAEGPGGQELVSLRLSAMMQARSSLGSIVIDALDKYTAATGTLSGVSEVLVQLFQLMAAAAGMPMGILFGVSSAGLRTGDDETRSWYADCESDRAKHHSQFEQLVRLFLLATSGPTGGKEPESWSAEFPSLWTPSEKEVAETHKTQMETDTGYIDAQVLTPEKVARDRFGGEAYSLETHIEAKDLAELAKLAVAPTPEEIAAEEADKQDNDPENPLSDPRPPARDVARQDFEPGQARDKNGRWTVGARAAHVAEDAMTMHRVYNKEASDHEVEQVGAASVAATHALHDSEQAALARGDISAPKREHLDRMYEVRDQTVEALDKTQAEIDRHQEAVLVETDRLGRFSEDDDDLGDFSHGDIAESLHRSSESIGELSDSISGKDRTEFDREAAIEHLANHNAFHLTEIPEHPDESGDDLTPAEHKAALHEYQEAVSKRRAELVAQAERAQEALEKLQAAQAETAARLKSIEKTYDKAYSKANSEHSRQDPDNLVSDKFEAHRNPETGDFDDPAVNKSYSDAHDAADSLLESHATELGRFEHGFEDQRLTFRNAIHDTSQAIRALSKITGRKPAGKHGKAP